MAASIGSLNVILTGSANGLIGTFKSASASASSFASDVIAKINPVNAALAGLGAVLSIGAAIGFIKEAADRIGELGHKADQLGTTTEALSRLQFAAKAVGIDSETLTHALTKLNENLGEAAIKGGPVADALTGIGLDAKQLAAESPDQVFLDIEKALDKIPNAFQRASVAKDIFGKSGDELLPLLNQGAEGIAKLEAEADKLGVTISSIDSQKVLQANGELAKAEATISSLAEKIEIKLAPFITDVTERLLNFAEKSGGVGTLVTSAFQKIAYGIAYASDFLYAIEAGWYLFEAAASGALTAVSWGVDQLAHGVAYLAKLMGKSVDTTFLDSLTDNLKENTDKLLKQSDDAYKNFQNGKNANAVTDYFNQVTQKADDAAQHAVDANHHLGQAIKDLGEDKDTKKITEILENLKQQIDDFGKSEGFKELTKLKAAHASPAILQEAEGYVKQLDTLKQQADVKKTLADLDKELATAGLDDAQKRLYDLQKQGANTDQLAQAKAEIDQIEAIKQAKEENKKLDEEAKRVLEESLSPLDKEKKLLEDLAKLYEAGKLTKEQYSKAVHNVEEKEREKFENATPKLIAANTNDAFKLINEATNRARGLGDKTPDKQLAEAKRSNQLLGQIAGSASKQDRTAPQQADILV